MTYIPLPTTCPHDGRDPAACVRCRTGSAPTMYALFTPSQAAQLTNGELASWEAHALNRRDAYAAGREPESVMSDLRAARAEQRRRREQRLARSWELLKSSAAS